jgi:hypothetical protein
MLTAAGRQQDSLTRQIRSKQPAKQLRGMTNSTPSPLNTLLRRVLAPHFEGTAIRDGEVLSKLDLQQCIAASSQAAVQCIEAKVAYKT